MKRDPIKQEEISDSDKKRFFSYVLKTDTCWFWTGMPSVTIGFRSTSPHKLSYLIHKGNPPAGNVIRHTCDRHTCVNPDHLIRGTQKQNAQDTTNRGRGRGIGITMQIAEQVRAKNKYGFNAQELAAMFNLKISTVRGIISGRTWRKTIKTEPSHLNTYPVNKIIPQYSAYVG